MKNGTKRSSQNTTKRSEKKIMSAPVNLKGKKFRLMMERTALIKEMIEDVIPPEAKNELA